MTKSSPLYVPALKWKQGEHFAVRPLPSAQKTRLLPIAEVPDRPYDWEKERYKKSWDKHLDDAARATSTNWGTTHEIAVDQQIADGETLSGKPGTPWEYLFQSMWAAGVKAVPVLSTLASGSQQAALTKVAKSHKKGRWVLRFRADPHGHVPTTAQAMSWFSNAVAAVGARHEHVDAVLDLGHITVDPKTLVASTAAVLNAVAQLGKWRQLTLLSGAFPVNLAGIQKGTRQIARLDWDLYKRVTARSELEGVDLAFGDYGITHVDAFEEDPRRLRMSANLRYTHWKNWQVLKGKNTRDYGFIQYKDLCGMLVGLPIFLGATFSEGDANYEKLATDPSVGPGSPMHWRRDATNHHIHLVLHQLASLPEF